jgi:hypothetical protein
MDLCTRGDNTVTGQTHLPQSGVAVHIQGLNTLGEFGLCAGLLNDK